MYSLTASKNMNITPKRAEEFLKRNTFPGQRPIQRKWVDAIVRKMQTGQFTKGAIAFGENGSGTETLMNGQHQCTASLLSGLSFTASVDYYHCDDQTDMWHLFATFDTQRMRTERHVMHAARGLFKDDGLKALPLRLLSSCGSALLFLGGGTTPVFNASPVSKSDKADLVEKFASDVLQVAAYGTTDIPVAVVTAIIATQRVEPVKCRPFWERVLDGDQLIKGTPQWSLNRGLANMAGNYGGGSRIIHAYRLCILWWNAFATGQGRTQANVKSMKSIPDVKKCKK